MGTISENTLFIELDALLDTRLAIIASLGEPYLSDNYTRSYHERWIDEFKGIPFEQFKALYDARDKSILKEAIITPMATLLKEFTMGTLNQIINTPFHYQPKIVLNIHPYDLTEDEITLLMTGLMGATLKKADLQVVNVDYAAIKPGYVKKHFSVMVLYEYYKWLEIHSLNDKFRKVTCPEVTLLAPAIYFKKPVPHNNKDKINGFEAMQQCMEPLIGLKLLPIENFSIILKEST